MQFKLSLATLAAIVAVVVANPSPEVTTEAEMIQWLKSTDANLTFIGEPIPGVNAPEGLVSRSAQNTMVTYCSRRVDNVCGGSCTVYNGGATCLSAPNTQCLAATNNVGFYDRGGCGGSCHQLSTCGTELDNGYCYTPGTASILVGNY
ncbi:uncharacterized protein B0H18DRAFT_953771 [Fomitopsis serialis]|uniref:uncharacterized protein n=1 Tax=Fomitopsis serialis TaxID=139415 RepID=UPI002007A128|nr:uncharacterized protein B0H18DRAFT_953771 [Neoantrodia serialis]KAH9928850.1 hypothetical protein B0H18DRAFT_953771 [Neoantrodia serialis]